MRRIGVLVAVVALSLIGLPNSPASAVIQVTRFDDPAQDGCAVNGCSLREAITQANLAANPDAIQLPAGSYTLALSAVSGEEANVTGDLDVRYSTTIQGAGAAATSIDANDIDRVLDIGGGFNDNTVTVRVSGVTLTDGDPLGTLGGGGVRSIVGLVELTDVVVRDNTANTGGGVLNIGQGSVVNISRSTVTGNTASGSGGGVYTDGLTTTNILDSTLSANMGGDSGGIYSIGTSSITNVTISGNKAEVDGGGIFNDGGALSATNVTISGNSAGGDGGGLYLILGGSAEAAVLNNVTVGGNTADSDADGGGNGGGLFREGQAVNVENSIIAGNTDASPGTKYPDCSQNSGSAFVSGGNNLVGNQTGCTLTPTPSDQVGTGAAPIDPRLGPLADNGGPTSTRALLAGSPAIDGGGPDCSTADQRGAPRSGACDSGAYELVRCAGVPVNRIGSEGADTLIGTSASDGFLAQGGNDVVKGLGGNDRACLGVGNDKAAGGGGKDKLLGEQGKDRLRGQGGNDRLRGGPGKDSCIGGPGERDKAACELEKQVP